MTQAGATGKRGSAFLVDRTALLSWTERVFKDESWQLQRHQETSAELSRSMAEVRALREMKNGEPDSRADTCFHLVSCFAGC
jgi:hypothetical protein